MLNEILERLNQLTPEDRNEIELAALAATRDMLWVPNFGPQEHAYFSEADELFYGGQAGGGKSSLAVGLSKTAHERSLILRRINKDAKKLAEAELIGKILGGDRAGWNGTDLIYRNGKQVIEFGGCELETDKQRYKGDPHDLIVFDEITDFLESQYLFITIWNRSTTPGQRCRVVCTGNPPTSATGLWVIKRWAAWLDPKHPSPARPGELRWYVRGEDDREVEVDGRGPFMVDGLEVYAKSRTFIPAGLSDNPDLNADGEYQRVLDMLPKELRDAYRDGRFDASLKDNPWQIIPTAWVVAAQERWTKQQPPGIPMSAIAIDVAQGGDDNNVISTRYDGWFAPLEKIPGKMTPLGTDCAGLLVARRRDGAKVVVDCGGGYGGSTYKQLNDNDIDVVAHLGSEGSAAKTVDGKLGFNNKRTESIWKFREALDPSKPGGSNIMLPPDTTLLGDLTAVTYQVKLNKIHAEPKEDVCARLGRSTDDGDSVVMCWAYGEKLNMAPPDWLSYGHRPAPVLGHEAARSKYSGRTSLSQSVRSRR